MKKCPKVHDLISLNQLNPKKLESKIEQLSFFFRKLPFSNAEFKKDHHQIILQTEMGLIPINSSDENLVKNFGIIQKTRKFNLNKEERLLY